MSGPALVRVVGDDGVTHAEAHKAIPIRKPAFIRADTMHPPSSSSGLRGRTLTVVAYAVLALTARPDVQSVTGGSRGLTAVQGIRVGHVTLAERPTGCTVILVDGDAVGGVSQRGGAPGTRETDLLDPLNMVDKVNAVVLSGGSAYGLDAAQGVVR